MKKQLRLLRKSTLWYHNDVKGENHSELSIKFTDLVQVKFCK